jgi:hypothetical protein
MARLWRILVAALTGLLVGGAGWAATPDPDLVARIDAALANRRVVATTQRGATTSTNDITLCGSHRVRLHATTTSPAGDNDQLLDGTWAIELLEETTPLLSLSVGESTPRRFAVIVDDDGTPFFYGFATTTEDASGACTAPAADG